MSKNILKISFMLSSLALSTFLAGQGMGSNSNTTTANNNCRPTTIVGEQNPSPGEEYTYTHDYEHQNGEEFVWEVEGASEVDGAPANPSGATAFTKTGNGINVIWDSERPTGRIKVNPVSECAELAQTGGLGGVVVVNFNVFDYEWCSSHYVEEKLLQTNPKYAARRAQIEEDYLNYINNKNNLNNFIIPVVVHVIHNESTYGVGANIQMSKFILK